MILLCGGKGSIGKRYSVILKDLGIPFDIYDVNERYSNVIPSTKLDKYSHFIIATPTETHLPYLDALVQHGKPILCEKPLTKSKIEFKDLNPEKYPNVYVVNNYAYLSTNIWFPETIQSIEYNFFNTGRDGLIWDTCQLVYLSELTKSTIEVHTSSWFWQLRVNEHDVTYRDIETTYFQMIRDFVHDDKDSLWTLAQGKRMSELCFELEEKGGYNLAGFIRDPSSQQFQTFSE